ncbi:MAG: hypothetical protein IKZ44_06960 [Clostridia bacterium]|nr:hypothetical protein [Clostridia bacterium]
MGAVKKRWIMSDSEIAVSFRQAADKRHQIRIIAELNLKTIDETVEKLNTLGFDTKQFKKDKTYRLWKAEDIKLLMRCKDVYGLSWKEIGKMLNRSPEACSDKYLRTKGGYESDSFGG